MRDDHTVEQDGRRITRRGALSLAGAVGVGSVLGSFTVDVAGAGASAEPIDPAFENVRVREARQAWDRGYRGRTNRALALTDSGTDSRHPDLGPWNGVTVTTENGFELDHSPDRGLGGSISPTTPKLVGWHNDDTTYGGFEAPRDSNGHGSHVASIMTGTGRASAVDPDRVEEDEPNALLLLGDARTYEVTAAAGTGVFASAYGDAIEIRIEGPDGEELARSTGANGLPEVALDNNIVETPTVHGDGEATYRVHVTAIGGELLTAGRLHRIAVGAFKHPDETVGDRVAGGDQTIHAGVAPNASLVSLAGLSAPTVEFGDHAAAFVESFGVRALNMSWGYVGGLPLGAAGGTLDQIPGVLSDIAGAGVLPVAAAGNDATPATGNGAPAVANEAISVVATGPRDGIAAYSSGGIGGIDESGEPYAKPDITAPGGTLTVLDIAARTGEPEDDVTTESPDGEAADADLEPVASLDEVSDDLAPKTDLDPSIAGPAEYDVSLSDDVLDSLTIDSDLLSPETQIGARQEGDGRDGVRAYTGKAGTSMASPSVCGMAGLVADAMEADAPAAIALPEPTETAREDVLRLKQVLLATATETALTAAPYHRAKAPVYRFGGRDPFEGYGRANLGPAIDAAARDLTDRAVSGSVGLSVPRDERAVAGYVHVDEPGELDVELAFETLAGANASAAKGDPHLDLFVYDAQRPDPLTGDPTVVAKDAGLSGDASVSVGVGADDLEANGGERVFHVVAKLVSIPGLATGFDARANVALETAFDAADLVVDGTRDDSGSVFTGGQTNRTDLDVAVRHPNGTRVLVRDTVPDGWTVDEEHGDVEATTPAFGGGTHVYFGLEDASAVYEDLTHFAAAPDEIADSDRDTFGPIAVTTETGDEGTLTDREWTTLSGTERTVTVAAEET
ncbi:S8 family serine peptidase [Haloferacaceae archaeon DSL9]